MVQPILSTPLTIITTIITIIITIISLITITKTTIKLPKPLYKLLRQYPTHRTITTEPIQPKQQLQRRPRILIRTTIPRMHRKETFPSSRLTLIIPLKI